MTAWRPSRIARAISSASRPRDSGASNSVPPSLMSAFTRTSQQARRFLAAEHQIHVLDGLARGALHQIVDGADDDRSSGGRVELESDIAEVGPVDGTDIWQASERIKAH